MTREDEQARLLRCIGEPTRLRILKLLAGGEKCVGEIIKALNKEQSLISHHLKALKECNIVEARQEAQKIYYKLADPSLGELALASESIVKKLILCQVKGERYEGEENQGCGESSILTNS